MEGGRRGDQLKLLPTHKYVRVRVCMRVRVFLRKWVYGCAQVCVCGVLTYERLPAEAKNQNTSRTKNNKQCICIPCEQRKPYTQRPIEGTSHTTP